MLYYCFNIAGFTYSFSTTKTKYNLNLVVFLLKPLLVCFLVLIFFLLQKISLPLKVLETCFVLSFCRKEKYGHALPAKSGSGDPILFQKTCSLETFH